MYLVLNYKSKENFISIKMVLGFNKMERKLVLIFFEFDLGKGCVLYIRLFYYNDLIDLSILVNIVLMLLIIVVNVFSYI